MPLALVTGASEGLGRYGDFATSDERHSQQMIRLNCEALVALSRAFLANAREGDALVNVSGLLGLLPVPGMSVYAGTKGFILSFSQALWHEQKERGVYVMALLPGPIATDFKSRSGGCRGRGQCGSWPSFIDGRVRLVASDHSSAMLARPLGNCLPISSTLNVDDKCLPQICDP